MLFWIFVLLFVVGVACIIAYECTPVGEWAQVIGGVLMFLFGVALIVSLLFIGDAHIGVDGKVAALQERYESLIYQYENDVYDNDNDLGKRELIKDIQSWNESLAQNREIQDDVWIGIFIPDIYDQFEFIELTRNYL